MHSLLHLYLKCVLAPSHDALKEDNESSIYLFLGTTVTISILALAVCNRRFISLEPTFAFIIFHHSLVKERARSDELFDEFFTCITNNWQINF